MRALIFALMALLTVIFLHLYTPPAHAAAINEAANLRLLDVFMEAAP